MELEELETIVDEHGWAAVCDFLFNMGRRESKAADKEGDSETAEMLDDMTNHLKRAADAAHELEEE